MRRIHRWKARMPRGSLSVGWDELSRNLRALRESVTQRRSFIGDGHQEEDFEERGLLQDVEQCIASSEEIALSTGVLQNSESSLAPFPHPPGGPPAWHSPIGHGSTISSSHPDSRTEEQVSDDSDGESIADPEPELDVSFTADAYESIIGQLSKNLDQEMSDQDYPRAERTYRSLEKRYVDRATNLGIPFDNRSELKEKLAKIYLHQRRFRKAKGVLVPLLHEVHLEADRKWRLYFLLAKTYYSQRQLGRAEKFARGSLKGRDGEYGKEHPLTQESALLVISIYEAQDDMETAMALRGHYCPQTIPPPPPRSVLRTTQRRREASNSTSSSNIPPIPQPQPTGQDRDESHPSHNNHVQWGPNVWINEGGINKLTESGKTQLIEVIYKGDEEVVQILLRRGAKVESPCAEHIRPLMHAVTYGHEGIVKILIDHGATVDFLTSGWTPLHRATQDCNLSIMRLLLTHGANIEAKSPLKFMAPMTDKARLRAIANNEPDVDIITTSDATDQGWTPLLRAASNGDEPAVRLLLDHSAVIDARSPTEATPLMVACENLHFATVDLLLMRGANIQASDVFGWKPLHRALVNPSLESRKIFQRLVDHEADVNARCNYRKTPLHYAVAKNDESAVKFLLAKDADFEARDVAERTPLHTAIECRHKIMVRLLIDHGADAAAQDQGGRDALAVATHADRKSPEIISLLKAHKKRMKKEISQRPHGNGAKGGNKGVSSGFGKKDDDVGVEGSVKKDKAGRLTGKGRAR
ncbi:MAG: hypothetical protein Q9186_005275 [Xanthomendoza sp. 1 TL-2023]